MAIKYYKLFDIMQRRDLSKTQISESVGISSATMAKLSAHKPVNMEIINRLCEYLEVQPGEILEFVSDEEGA
ncbi:MAG: helix-turn-helix domain-containing protein [Oscillospiraceae bacterium]|nr:XRE family transcriptional regulator [Oscillospiraceae bacterium]MDD6479427.1 helix-turn-helix domain-containing protein [Oscillospiraceae bacterium]